MIIIQIVEFLASFTEAIIGILMIGRILGESDFKERDSITLAVLIAVLIWIANQYQIFSISTTLLGIVGIAVSTCFIYRKKFSDSLVFSIAYLLFIYIIDFVSISVLAIVTQKGNFANIIIESFSGLRLCHVILSKTMVVLVYYFFSKKIQTNIKISLRKMIAAIIIGAVIVCYFAKASFERTLDTEVIIMWFFLFAIVLIGIYFANQYILYLREKDRMEIAIKKIQMLEKAYGKEVRNYQKQQVFFHDLENHFLIIKNYLEKKEYFKATKYVEQMGFRNSDLLSSWTGIDALDILIEYKKKEAESEGIFFDVLLENIYVKLADQEIVALVGNLLDNAIEACIRMKRGTRWIKLIIRKVKDMTFIKVSNSYNEQLVERDEGLISTKQDSQVHGLGLSNIKLIVEKNEGEISIDYGMDSFYVIVSFFN